MLSTAPGVFTSGEELKPSLLDDELIKDWLINYAPPTSISHPLDVTPVMNSPSPSPSFVALPQITEEQKNGVVWERGYLVGCIFAESWIEFLNEGFLFNRGFTIPVILSKIWATELK